MEGIEFLRNSEVAYKITVGLVDLYQFLLFYLAIPFVPLLRKLAARRFKAKTSVRINPEKSAMRRGDLIVSNDYFYPLWVGYGTLGVGQAYMKGWWESNDLEEFFVKIFSNDLQYDSLWSRTMDHLKFGFLNLQTPTKSWEVGQKHYDLGNELYEKMLDSTMTYTCAYWKDVTTLEEAQIKKMELVAQKLKLQPGMKVLELGCGWGGLCKYLAEKYKVKVVGCTIGVEGAKYGQERCKGLPVEIRACDYREIQGKFDRIVSVGMFEHVGRRNYGTFFETANRCLKDDGILVTHFIGTNNKNVPQADGWITTYIFPGGSVPYPEDVCMSSDELFIIEDWQNMSFHYHLTLRSWLHNFNKNWPSIKKNYEDPETFYRMWTYYLIISSAMFRSRRLQLWQVVFTKKGLTGGYDAPR